MQDGYNQEKKVETTTIIQTDLGAKNGQDKCPKCGATDISLNEKNGLLRCNFCRHEFEPKKLEILEGDILSLNGQVIGSGAQDILENTKDIMTFKCSSCGAEVVIDTSFSTQARCHWCRNTLSVQEQIPNGSIPDAVLPFRITKEEAKQQIEQFVGKRKFFANPKFKKEFCLDNIMGVYFPYMVIDINAQAHFEGEGKTIKRKYMRQNEMVGDMDIYKFKRDFTIMIQGLTIESNKERLESVNFHQTGNAITDEFAKGIVKLSNPKTDFHSNQTNNVINAIMPFDIQNKVQFNANYLKGYTSEKRNMNIETLKPIVNAQTKEIARFAARETLKNYDGKITFSQEDLSIKGIKWITAYLPVWLYSYQHIKGENKILHYVAVNARTKETMGSVPIHYPKLIGLSIGVEIIGIFAYLFVDFPYSWLLLFLGIVYFFFFYFRYRNSNARHEYEKDTQKEIANLEKEDTYLKSEKAVSFTENMLENVTLAPISMFGKTLQSANKINEEIKKESEK